jgi:hypothetical protein
VGDLQDVFCKNEEADRWTISEVYSGDVPDFSQVDDNFSKVLTFLLTDVHIYEVTTLQS